VTKSQTNSQTDEKTDAHPHGTEKHQEGCEELKGTLGIKANGKVLTILTECVLPIKRIKRTSSHKGWVLGA
jgi:hypothetical protein